MRKLFTAIFIFMLITTLVLSARSGDKFDLKKLIEWQNTIYLEGIVDTSLTRSNAPNVWEECNTEPIPAKQSVSYYEKETGGVKGMQLIDEFRAVAKVGKVPFFTNLVMMDVQLAQRFYLVFGNVNQGVAVLWNGIGLDESQYRSYLTCSWTFGSSPVKYQLGAEIQMRLVFSAAGITNVRVIPYVSNKINISKWLEIQANVEQTLRWDATTNTDNDESNNNYTRSNYNFDFRIGSPGMAGGGYHYLTATPKRADGYNLGPISLAWRIRSRYDLGLRHQRWKDTDPGSDNDTNRVSSTDVQKGIADDWKFRTEEDIWVNVLKSVNLIDLIVGGYHFLMMDSNYAYNWPSTIQMYQDIGVGAELVLDKTFFIGVRARIILNDFFNAWGIPLINKEGKTDEWYSGTYGTSSMSTGMTKVGPDGYTYAAIPQGNGRIGPHIFVGYVKDAFEWVFSYQGLANFRTYDLYKDNFAKMATTYGIFRTTGYWDWRNEIESWVTWKW